MEIDRAKQIFNALGVVEIYYQGYPVWIEKIKDDKALVQNLDTNQILEAPVHDLVESEMYLNDGILIPEIGRSQNICS
jgi:small acid-soluble spore protein H (minor)